MLYYIMPKRTKKSRRMKGGNQQLRQIQTANRNLVLDQRLLSAKPPLQQPGQLARPLSQYGGALTDRFGAYLYIPHI